MFKKHLIFCLVLLSSMWIQGQANVRDSILNVLSNNPSDSIRWLSYNDLGSFYLNSQLDSSIHFSKKALDFANEIKDENKIVLSLNLVGNFYERKAEYDTAMDYYNEGLEISRRSNNTLGLSIILNNIAIIHTDQGEYDKAISMYQEALDCEIILKNDIGIAQAYNNIGIIYYYNQDLKKCTEYMEKSILISERLGDEDNLKRGFNNLGAIFDYDNNNVKALEYYNKALALSKKLNDKREIGQNLHNIATIYDKTNDYEAAKEYHLKSITIREEIEDYGGLCNGWTNYATVLVKEGNFKEAEKIFLKSISIGKKYQSRYALKETYNKMAEFYMLQGKGIDAYNYQVKFTNLQDSILNIEKTKVIKDIEAKYETERIKRENAETEKQLIVAENEKIASDLKLSTRTKWVYGLIGLAASIFFLSLFFIQKNKRKVQGEKDAAIIKERDIGLKAVFQAQEEERSRISKDLHDGIGQQLSGLKMAWQDLTADINEKVPEKSNRLSELTSILDESAEEVRNISHQMMPRSLQELGLAPAIEDLLSKTFGNTKIKYEFEKHNVDQRFKKEIELSVYRVCQELINNIIKHSNASYVSTQILKNKQHLVLIVEDNGKGFDINTSKKGHGILNMTSRMNMVNGDINMEPSPNSGMIATLRIPIID